MLAIIQIIQIKGGEVKRNKILKLGLVVLGLLATLAFAGGCVPAEEGTGETSIWVPIIFLVVIFGLMYLVSIRPQRKRQKEHQQLVEELKRGDKVITVGGIYGVVESVNEDSAVIKVESGASMRVAKGSLAGKIEKKESF